MIKLSSEKFRAEFSATLNDWRIKTDDFNFWVKYLAVEGIENPVKLRYQKIEATNAVLALCQDWVKLCSWSRIRKRKYYCPYDPDMPRSLAKSVTVR